MYIILLCFEYERGWRANFSFMTFRWADLMQMASAVAVEHAGGPKIPMKYGMSQYCPCFRVGVRVWGYVLALRMQQ